MTQKIYLYLLFGSLYAGLATVDLPIPFSDAFLRITLLEPLSVLLALSLAAHPGMLRQTLSVFAIMGALSAVILGILILQVTLIEGFGLSAGLRAALRQIGVLFVFASYVHLFGFIKRCSPSNVDEASAVRLPVLWSVAPILIIVVVLTLYHVNMRNLVQIFFSMQFIILLLSIMLLQIFYMDKGVRNQFWFLLSLQFLIVSIFAYWIGSTTALLLALFSAGIVAFYYGPFVRMKVSKKKNKIAGLKIRIGDCFAFAMALSVVLYLFANTGRFSEFDNMVVGLVVRAGLWSIAFNDILASPWLGIGLGQVSQTIIFEPDAVRAAPNWLMHVLSVDPETRANFPLSSVHNTPLNLVLAYGIPLAALFCFGLMLLLYNCVKNQPVIFSVFVLTFAAAILLLSDGLTVRGLIALLAFSLVNKIYVPDTHSAR